MQVFFFDLVGVHTIISRPCHLVVGAEVVPQSLQCELMVHSVMQLDTMVVAPGILGGTLMS